MPNISSHMVVAKLVSEKLHINDSNFIKGNLLPDVVNNSNSHHKIPGKYYVIPDTEFFKQKLNLKNKLELGYFTHLLLDKYFLEEYIPNNISDLKIFENKSIYHEYDLINAQLVQKFKLDVEDLQNCLGKISGDINKEKLAKNIAYLAHSEKGETNYLDVNSFSTFLENISQRICEEIKEYIN